ncbi:MAG: response regulator [Verrucomicrobiota bacterium]
MEQKRKAKKILVVDDHVLVMRWLERALQMAGHQIHTAQSYQHAVNALSEVQFDLIITDIELGNESGIDLIQQIDRETALFFMSGNPEYLQRKELEAYPFFLKPFPVEALLRSVESSFLQIQDA